MTEMKNNNSIQNLGEMAPPWQDERLELFLVSVRWRSSFNYQVTLFINVIFFLYIFFLDTRETT